MLKSGAMSTAMVHIIYQLDWATGPQTVERYYSTGLGKSVNFKINQLKENRSYAHHSDIT